MFDATLAAALEAGFVPRPAQKSPRITMTLGLVAAGLGAALVPASTRRVQMDGVANCDQSPADRPTVPRGLPARREPVPAVMCDCVDLVRRPIREDVSVPATATVRAPADACTG